MWGTISKDHTFHTNTKNILFVSPTVFSVFAPIRKKSEKLKLKKKKKMYITDLVQISVQIVINALQLLLACQALVLGLCSVAMGDDESNDKNFPYIQRWCPAAAVQLSQPETL